MGALYGSGVAKRARRRQRERRDGLTSGGSADLVEYRGWVGSVLERARRELGVGDSCTPSAGSPRKSSGGGSAGSSTGASPSTTYAVTSGSPNAATFTTATTTTRPCRRTVTLC